MPSSTLERNAGSQYLTLQEGELEYEGQETPRPRRQEEEPHWTQALFSSKSTPDSKTSEEPIPHKFAGQRHSNITMNSDPEERVIFYSRAVFINFTHARESFC